MSLTYIKCHFKTVSIYTYFEERNVKTQGVVTMCCLAGVNAIKTP